MTAGQSRNSAAGDRVGYVLEASRLYQSGLAHLQLGNSQPAAAFFRQALALNPQLASAHYNLGAILQASNRYDEAIAHYEKAIALKPDDFAAHNNLGNALVALNRLDDAIAHYQRALALRPDLAGTHMNFGNALQAAGRHEDAVRAYGQALALKPDLAAALMNLGNSLQALEQTEAAIRHYRKALALTPAYPEAHMNLASSLERLTAYDEAVAHYRQAIALDPNYGKAHTYLGLLCLSLGRFAEGWEHYEHRWAGMGIARRGYLQPRWNGEHIRGRLLVWGEQGLGDQILYAGMIPDLAPRADAILLEVEPRLVPLFARSFPAVQVIGIHEDLHAGAFAMHEPLGGLGKHLRTSWDAFPRRERGYLIADPGRVAQLRQRLTRDKRAVIGLSWRSHNPLFGKSKSARLADFQTVLRLPDTRYVDLQYGDTDAERASVEHELGIKVERLQDIDNTNDIDGLAALICACDAVATVSNTTAHLAGALGAPTWVFVPYGHARIWYWFKEGDRSPWYPRVHVRRQSGGQSWSQLISATQDEIADFLRLDRTQGERDGARD
jgi:tetratricopeptide (TPR) repeat protein